MLVGARRIIRNLTSAEIISEFTCESVKSHLVQCMHQNDNNVPCSNMNFMVRKTDNTGEHQVDRITDIYVGLYCPESMPLDRVTTKILGYYAFSTTVKRQERFIPIVDSLYTFPLIASQFSRLNLTFPDHWKTVYHLYQTVLSTEERNYLACSDHLLVRLDGCSVISEGWCNNIICGTPSERISSSNNIITYDIPSSAATVIQTWWRGWLWKHRYDIVMKELRALPGGVDYFQAEERWGRGWG